MAWKRNYGGRRKTYAKGRASVASLARAVATKARKRYQWVPLVDDLCQRFITTARTCCGETPTDYHPGCVVNSVGALVEAWPSPLIEVFVPPVGASTPEPDQLKVYERDEVKIVRLVGEVRVQAFTNLSPDIAALIAADPNNTEAYQALNEVQARAIVRAGLAKDRWVWDEETLSYSAPIRDPLRTQEWSDGQFLRQWSRHLEAQSYDVKYDSTGTANIGCCPDIVGSGGGTTGLPDNAFVDGTGTVDIDPIEISSTCQPCPGVSQQFLSGGIYVHLWKPWRFPLNLRRPIVLKENEGLTFWLNWSGLQRQPGQTFEATPGIYLGLSTTLKALVEV